MDNAFFEYIRPNGNLQPIVIERCTTPRGELQLQQRGTQYEIISNGMFLMATYNGISEKLLVKAALDRVSSPDRILIGGMGVGFSLAAALEDQRVTHVSVLEIEEKIIEWNQGCLASFSNHALEDPRTEIIHTDLIDWIQSAPVKYNAICLDIDNGPDWTLSDHNSTLYSEQGLKLLSNLLTSGGVVAFWSASSSTNFMERLKLYFTSVEKIEVEQPKGEPDYIFLATR